MSFFGLRWNHRPEGLADGVTADSATRARALRRKLLSLNPRLVLLAEIRYRDAPASYLPEGHRWWLRDGAGKIVPGWEEGGYFCLDFHAADYRRHVANQARAVVASGAVDGVMLDWWQDDDDRLALIREVRGAIGEQALILCNANDRTTPRTAPFINGYFMECTRSKNAKDWNRIASSLLWAEKHLRTPRINCLEIWCHNSRQELNRMRATTALALTCSDGFCLFSDPNPLPTPDHLHDWYPFWDRRLGRPVGPGRKDDNGTFIRRFDKGCAVFNPPDNKAQVVFETDHTSLSTGRTSKRHSLDGLDGDIYLQESAKDPSAQKAETGSCK